MSMDIDKMPQTNGVASIKAQAVFNIPELLEPILSLLPPRTILASASRVSQQWKSAIEASPGIRPKLFLRPTKTVTEPRRYYEWDLCQPIYAEPLTLNPILFEGETDDHYREGYIGT